MTDSNPYSTPSAKFSQADDETYQPTVFSFSGRIGRLRYLAYSIPWALIMWAAMFVLGIVAAILIPTMGDSAVGLGLIVLIWVVFAALSLIPMFSLAVRRLNDMNMSGWLSLIMLLPLINFIMVLVFLFAPGTKGKNNYGPPPVENSTLVIIGALIFPLGGVAILGMIAAVALPAYQDYTLRAQTSEAFNQSDVVRDKVENYFLVHDEMPAQNQDIDHHYRNDSPYVESIDVTTGGVITMVISSANRNVNEKTVVYRPSTNNGFIEWDCTGGDLEFKYRPPRCRPN